MAIFILLTILALLGCFIDSNRFQKTYYALLLVMMMCISGARSINVGPDTHNYILVYSKIAGIWSNEFLFFGIMQLLKSYGFRPVEIQFAFSMVTFIPLILLLLKKSNNIAISVLVYIFAYNIYFFETMNIVRQSCALPYLLWSIVLLSEKKYVKSAIMFIISIGFHTSSIFAIPMIVLSYLYRPSLRTATIILFITMIIGFTTTISQIVGLIDLLSSFKFLNIERYATYSEWHTDRSKYFTLLFIIIVPASICAFYSYKQYSQSIITRIYFYSVALNNILCVLPNGFRATFCLVALEILLYPLIIRNKDKKINIIVLSSLLFLIAVTDFVRLPSPPSKNSKWFVPYEIDRGII